MKKFFKLSVALTIVHIIGFINTAQAQEITPELYKSMRWRMIGPHRGGRTVGAAGIADQPNVFYIGVNNGGVWKTTDYGQTWTPIFDDQPTGSIGTLAVAPSNPDIIYVGSGEGIQRPDLSTGDGIYKSIDAGKTWRHLGLRDGEQIASIIIDPHNPDRLFVAVLGHPYGPNEQRGVFRSVDGGETWKKVLYKDEDTGAIALGFDPSNPKIIFASLWQARLAPWENGNWKGPGSGIFKSTDGGDRWKKLTKGLPTFEQGLGRIGFDIARSDPDRMYALVNASENGGLYRSDDAGESWKLVNNIERRIWGRGNDFAEVRIDPKNKDIVYSANVSLYKSINAGETFTAIRGAPGGDDYHSLWINPDNPDIMLTAVDQGAVITVNGGKTWSSWYNQPTAQFYHVSTDNQIPYWVYGGQQESGSIGIRSRGDDGQITFREWHSVGGSEYAYIAPDPMNSNIIYSGKVVRYDKTTNIRTNVGPKNLRSTYRSLRTAPLLFSTVDPSVLFFGANVIFKTKNGGENWEIISPDLTCESPEVPECIGVYRTAELTKQKRRGVIYTIAPSYKDINFIWAGTDDGLIHITRDGGKNWKDVTPAEITSWSKISIMDAGRFDKETAYAAVNRIRLDDQRPYIYRTHDGGKNWTKIVNGLPDNGPVNTIREDPQRRGLLFAGTERAIYVSFNDGDNWLPLRLNMPASSMRDLVVHNDDIVVGTHGRSFWILDDITPLRQINNKTALSEATLFKPQLTYLYPRNLNNDTPLPPEEPAGQNPPDGAIINYYLKSNASGVIKLEIFDKEDKLIRRFASNDEPEKLIESRLTYPTYWIRPPQVLSGKAGSHRFIWDLHYPPPEGSSRRLPISAIYMDTPSTPMGEEVLPGEYLIKLTVNERSYTQTLTVKPDPRLK